MGKINIFVIIILFLGASLSFAEEEITITTYYPSPYGSYRQLTADQIAIGSGYRNPTYADGSLYVQGNVGIGTTSPQGKLNVYLSEDSPGGSTLTPFLIKVEKGVGSPLHNFMTLSLAHHGFYASSGTGGSIDMELMGSTTTDKILTLGAVSMGYDDDINCTDSDFFIRLRDNDALTERFRITSDGVVRVNSIKFPDNTIQTTAQTTSWAASGNNIYNSNPGNVGIGTIDPRARLHVYGTNATFKVNNTTSDYLGLAYYEGANDLYLGGSSSQDGNLYIKNFSGTTQVALNSNGASYFTGGSVGIGTANLSGRLSVGLDSGRLLGLTNVANTNTFFRFQTDGNAYADGTWNGGGADYAEWFEKEGDLQPMDVVGLNIETGKVRRYVSGDILVGIYSKNPGFVGNRDEEKTDEEMAKDHALVALMGQVDFDRSHTQIIGRKVYTKDGYQVGYLLSNGRVMLRISQ